MRTRDIIIYRGIGMRSGRCGCTHTAVTLYGHYTHRETYVYDPAHSKDRAPNVEIRERGRTGYVVLRVYAWYCFCEPFLKSPRAYTRRTATRSTLDGRPFGFKSIILLYYIIYIMYGRARKFRIFRSSRTSGVNVIKTASVAGQTFLIKCSAGILSVVLPVANLRKIRPDCGTRALESKLFSSFVYITTWQSERARR